ncbi:MAG: capsule assembly Wzi family protein [Acidobacteriota bacterium]
MSGVAASPAVGSDAGAGQPGAMAGTGGNCLADDAGSPYVPVDWWVYPAVLRLYSLGYLDHVFLNMRPWTRVSMGHMLENVADKLGDGDPGPGRDQAEEIFDALARELRFDASGSCLADAGHGELESTYSVVRGISGTPLRDSFHLGSTIVNDYGRPYAHGFNNYTGLSGYATSGRFALYARWEFQGSPSATGYSAAVAQNLSENLDQIPFINPATGQPYQQATIPLGPISAMAQPRVVEAYVSANVLNHVISLGKVDQWLGPGQGGSFAYSNNAENIYGFEINRMEPLRVPFLSRFTGPFRYEFLIGPLQGHTYVPNPAYEANPSPYIANVIAPGNPWVHMEKVSFRPSQNLEFGFERTAIWGGKGHGPITLHTFLKSFFSVTAPGGPGSTGPDQKFGRDDPGARFGAFDTSYRLPFVRNWLTLYAEGEVHDDLSPIDAPRRAAWRPGIYLSHFPGAPKLDLRVEAAYTNLPISLAGHGGPGRFMYWETIQKQGYTNQGQIFGDWIGRDDSGGQAWLTWHLSGNEWIQVNARNQKAAKDFIATPTTQYGSTINDLGFQAVKRIGKDFEINGNFTLEHYKEPIYLPGQQTVTTTNVQLTWFPGRKVNF